jgi:hypothetical protein
MNTPPNPFDPSPADKLDDICAKKHGGHGNSVVVMPRGQETV